MSWMYYNGSLNYWLIIVYDRLLRRKFTRGYLRTVVTALRAHNSTGPARVISSGRRARWSWKYLSKIVNITNVVETKLSKKSTRHTTQWFVYFLCFFKFFVYIFVREKASILHIYRWQTLHRWYFGRVYTKLLSTFYAKN